MRRDGRLRHGGDGGDRAKWFGYQGRSGSCTNAFLSLPTPCDLIYGVSAI